MPIINDFEYHRAKSVKEACDLLKKYNGKAAILAGGTDIVCELKDGARKVSALIDIKNIAELKRLELIKNELWIGALVTFNEIASAKPIKESFPLLMEAAKKVGSNGLRNRATLVGNICSAVPCLDSGPPLLAYDGFVHLQGPKTTRKVAINEWFKGPRKTAIKSDEIVLGVSVPIPGKRCGACFIKLGRYSGEDLAQGSVAVLALPGNKYRVAFGSLAPTPLRTKKLEAFISGKKLSTTLIEEAKKLVAKEISPITDIRASREYRVHMAKVMFERAITAAAERLKGNGPKYGTNLI